MLSYCPYMHKRFCLVASHNVMLFWFYYHKHHRLYILNYLFIDAEKFKEAFEKYQAGSKGTKTDDSLADEVTKMTIKDDDKTTNTQDNKTTDNSQSKETVVIAASSSSDTTTPSDGDKKETSIPE